MLPVRSAPVPVASLRRRHPLERRGRAYDPHRAPTRPHQYIFPGSTRGVFCFHRDTGAQSIADTPRRCAVGGLA
jgi:hypothetical protein